MSKPTPYSFYVETELSASKLSINVAGGTFSDDPKPEEKLLHALYQGNNPLVSSVELHPNIDGKIKVDVFFVK